jgi:hypothetical protein
MLYRCWVRRTARMRPTHLRAIATIARFLPACSAMRSNAAAKSGSLRIATQADSINTYRNRPAPGHEMWPIRRVSPLEASLGGSPVKLNNARSFENCCLSPTSLANTRAANGPMPGPERYHGSKGSCFACARSLVPQCRSCSSMPCHSVENVSTSTRSSGANVACCRISVTISRHRRRRSGGPGAPIGVTAGATDFAGASDGEAVARDRASGGVSAPRPPGARECRASVRQLTARQSWPSRACPSSPDHEPQLQWKRDAQRY